MEVICIKQHSQGILTIGNPYEVYQTNSCRCGIVVFDVGITLYRKNTQCRCGSFFLSSTIWWVNSRLFAPIEEKGEMFIEEFLVSQRTDVNITMNKFLTTPKLIKNLITG